MNMHALDTPRTEPARPQQIIQLERKHGYLWRRVINGDFITRRWLIVKMSDDKDWSDRLYIEALRPYGHEIRLTNPEEMRP